MKFFDLNTWWNQRPLREQLLLGAASVLAVGVLADTLFVTPIERKSKAAQTQVQALRARWDASAAGANAATGGVDLRSEEAALRERLARAQQELSELNQAVADSNRLPETLRAITATVGSARLLELDLTGEGTPSALSAPGSGASGAASAVAAAPAAATPVTVGNRKLYRLPISIKVAGSYGELQALLTAFERHAEALRWTSLALDSTEWPAIQMTVKAYVLSPQPRWGAGS